MNHSPCHLVHSLHPHYFCTSLQPAFVEDLEISHVGKIAAKLLKREIRTAGIAARAHPGTWRSRYTDRETYALLPHAHLRSISQLRWELFNLNLTMNPLSLQASVYPRPATARESLLSIDSAFLVLSKFSCRPYLVAKSLILCLRETHHLFPVTTPTNAHLIRNSICSWKSRISSKQVLNFQ